MQIQRRQFKYDRSKPKALSSLHAFRSGESGDAEKLPIRSFCGHAQVEGISAWKIVLPDGRCADDVPTDATVREGFKR